MLLGALAARHLYKGTRRCASPKRPVHLQASSQPVPLRLLQASSPTFCSFPHSAMRSRFASKFGFKNFNFTDRFHPEVQPYLGFAAPSASLSGLALDATALFSRCRCSCHISVRCFVCCTPYPTAVEPTFRCYRLIDRLIDRFAPLLPQLREEPFSIPLMLLPCWMLISGDSASMSRTTPCSLHSVAIIYTTTLCFLGFES